MQIGRYPSEGSHVAKTIWQMYLRHQQVMMPREAAAAYAKCGQCRHFNTKPTDNFEHTGIGKKFYRCGLFKLEYGLFDSESYTGSTDWSGDWLACGAFWAHEGELER